MKQFTGLLFIFFSLIWQAPVLAMVDVAYDAHTRAVFADDDNGDKKEGDKQEGDGEEEEEEEEPDCD